MRVTGGRCIMPAIRIWQTTPLIAPRKCLLHINPRSAACAISTAQDYEPPVLQKSDAKYSAPSPPLQARKIERSGPTSQSGAVAYCALRRRISAEMAGTT